MKISMEILYRESRGLNPVLYAKKRKAHMKYIGLYHASCLLSPPEGYLLFGPAGQFADSLSGEGIISIGKVSDILIRNNDVICYLEDTKEEELYRKLLSVFTLYEEWNSQMQYAVMKERCFQDIVEVSEPIFKNPILIHDINFNFLGLTDAEYGLQLWSRDSENRPVINMDVLNEFKVDKEYEATLSARGPAFFSDTMFGYRVLYTNLWLENQYYGRICICEIDTEVLESDLYLLDFMSSFIIQSFRMGYNMLSEKPRYLKNALYKIINGEPIEIQQLQAILEESRWTLEDSYFCACLFTDSRDIKTNTIRTTCQSLELRFLKACVFNYYDNIIMIVNTSLEADDNIDSFSSELSVFLREGLFKVGISSIGKDFLKLRYSYFQAVAAYEIGSQKDGFFWRFKFDDYVLQYIFAQSTRDIPKDMVSSKKLMRTLMIRCSAFSFYGPIILWSRWLPGKMI